MTTPQELIAIWVVFIAGAAGTIWLGLVLGKLIRPHHPSGEKLLPYECGEEPIGEARVQYDLRIYVAALLFLIFDVEIALLYPAGMMLGKLNRWRHSVANASDRVPRPNKLDSAGATTSLVSFPLTDSDGVEDKFLNPKTQPSPADTLETLRLAPSAGGGSTRVRWPDRRIAHPQMLQNEHVSRKKEVEGMMLPEQSKVVVGNSLKQKDLLHKVTWMITGEIVVFFAFLLLGYAYLWRCGDLEWFRPGIGQISSGTDINLRCVRDETFPGG